MTITTASGRAETRDGTTYLVLERTFRAPIASVWAAVTEPERLARWIGTWTGDPRDGEVAFQMLFEGEGPQDEWMRIDECDPPRRLAVTSLMPGEGEGGRNWEMTLDLSESDGVTTLAFGQSLPDPAWAESVGPGWEYYLDRLVAAETDGDPASIAFDDYYPSLSDSYKTMFGLG